MTATRKSSMRKTGLIATAGVVLIAAYNLLTSDTETSSQQNQTTSETEVAQERQPDVPVASKSVGNAPNFAAITDVKQKKQAFFDYLRPGIALENQRIIAERQRLETIQDNFESGSLTPSDTSYANRLGKLYNVELPANGVNKEWLNQMLHRVDVIPEALVLVQGANESAWGTSRFATEANNYFGQWCYTQGCGMVPLKRAAGMTHEVASFSSVQQSIHGYFMNVNRNNAYKDLREIRFQRHQRGQSLTNTDAAMALSRGLLKYSERGEAYVNDLQAMIRHNQQFWQAPVTKS